MEVCEIVSNRAVAINPLVDKKVRESQGKMQFVSDTLWQSYDLSFCTDDLEGNCRFYLDGNFNSKSRKVQMVFVRSVTHSLTNWSGAEGCPVK